MDHHHAEAFHLMKYATKDGSHWEMIWNSRDGVTPFMVHSEDGRTMEHVEWRSDQYAPEWVPPLGSRIFVDATLERCVEWSRDWLRRYEKDPNFQSMLREVYPNKSHDEIARQRGEEMLTEHGEPPPDVLVVTEGVLAWLNQHRGSKAGGSKGEANGPA